MSCLIEFHENYIIIKNEYIDIMNILCILKQISLNNIAYKAHILCKEWKIKNVFLKSSIQTLFHIFPHV